MKTPSTLRVHGVNALIAVLFSINYIVSKMAMTSFQPLTFAYLRVLGSAIVMALILPRGQRLAPADRKKIVLFGVLAVVINQSFFLAGLAFTSAHVAAILITTIPVFALATAIVLGRERATATKIGGIALAAAGALLVVGREGFFGGTRNSLLGDLLIVGNCLAYAIYLVVSKPTMQRLSPAHVVTRMFAAASVLMLPVAGWSLAHEHWAAIPPRAWLGLAVVIAGPTVAAYLLSGWALRHADSSLVAAYSYLQPVVTVILAAMFLGESIEAPALVAAAMIISGVWISGRPAPPEASEVVPHLQPDGDDDQ